MIHVHIEKSTYGLVDRVPGLFHVATEFWAVGGFPLIVTGTWLIQETDAPSPGVWLPIARSRKSQVMAYLRGVTAAVAVFTFMPLIVIPIGGVPAGVTLSGWELAAILVGIEIVCVLIYVASRWLSGPTRERAVELGAVAGIPEHDVVARL